MTSPTAVRRAVPVGPGDGDTVGPSVAPGDGDEPGLSLDEMTARRVLLSYELTASVVLWARPPELPGLAVAVAVPPAGAAATASERSAVPAEGFERRVS
ncbi:hypothetical protein [Streptomyces sp. HUAS ZL42]|uniref:hypothetical protein n=1 Tax=Streptomyces sp. HUAS ZL42 TaxID=3231715 RepID=UPI00345EA7F3